MRDDARGWDRAATAGTALPRWDPNRAPVLVPLFPIEPFTPRSTCPHHGPIRPGSVFCCMVCSQSGMDGHPALKRDPRTDPKPEPKTLPEASPRDGAGLTRKQRRKVLREARQAAQAPSSSRTWPKAG